MATSTIKSNGGEHTLLGSFVATTSFAEKTLSDDLKNYQYVYVATLGN
jgi:hypothetical protein